MSAANTYSNDAALTSIQIDRDGTAWMVKLYGRSAGFKSIRLIYEGSAVSLDDAFDQLDQWRRGVIII